MRSRPFALAVAWVLACATADADYLEVRHAAHLYKAADRTSESVLALEPGAEVELRSDEQDGGYYKVRTCEGKKGYVYRTLVRRFTGPLPESVAPHGTAPEPSLAPATPPAPAEPTFEPGGSSVDERALYRRAAGRGDAVRVLLRGRAVVRRQAQFGARRGARDRQRTE